MSTDLVTNLVTANRVYFTSVFAIWLVVAVVAVLLLAYVLGKEKTDGTYFAFAMLVVLLALSGSCVLLTGSRMCDWWLCPEFMAAEATRWIR